MTQESPFAGRTVATTAGSDTRLRGPWLAAARAMWISLVGLAVNLGMEALGWQVGGPRAEERGTMLTVLIASNLGAALVGGAMLGMTLTQRH